MTINFKLNSCNEIEMQLGKTYFVESITQAVNQEFLLVGEELRLPSQLELMKIEPLDGEGVIGNVYSIKAKKTGVFELTSSLENMKTGSTLKSKTVKVIVR